MLAVDEAYMEVDVINNNNSSPGRCWFYKEVVTFWGGGGRCFQPEILLK